MAHPHDGPGSARHHSAHCVAPPETSQHHNSAYDIINSVTTETSHLRHYLREAYSGDEDLVDIENDEFWKTPTIIGYDALKLSTYRVFFARGSAFEHPVLLLEAFLTFCLFACTAIPSILCFHHKHAGHSIGGWIEEQEDNMRSFAVIMTGVTTFLLSFYTTMSLNRWWTIIINGIGGIEKALMELTLYTYQLVTKDENVALAIRRYARSSLFLIVLWRRGEMKRMKELFAMKQDLLTPSECDKLLGINHNLHETIWAWITDIVAMLYEEGKINSDCLLQLLLDRCTAGRGAVQLIHTHIAIKIPMHYVHLLSSLVKVHNSILACIMGALFGAAFMNSNAILCLLLCLRTLLLPMLFNAILLINSELSDPFDGGSSDIPTTRVDENLDLGAQAYLACTDNAPAWISERRARNIRDKKYRRGHPPLEAYYASLT